MNKKYTGIFLAGGIIAFILSVLILFNLTIQYRSNTGRIKSGFESNGRSIAEAISESYISSVSMMTLFQDYLYNEMINDFNNDKTSFLKTDAMPYIVNDTITEGFYFSAARNAEYFKVTIFEGRKIYEFRRDKVIYNQMLLTSGAGKYIQKLKKLAGIKYIVLQDNIGIITATENIDTLSSIISDSALTYAIMENEEIFRKVEFRDSYVYEYVYPVAGENTLLRIGFDALLIENAINSSKLASIVILLLAVFFISFVWLMIFYYSRALSYSRKVIKQEHEKAQYFSLVSDAIISIEKDGTLECNKGGFRLFGSECNFDTISKNTDIKRIIDRKNNVDGIEMTINEKQILLSSIYNPETDKTILVLKDITEIEKLKEVNRSREKDAMLGEFSFKIAHELKNPLNGISIILQRIFRRDALTDEEKSLIQDAFEEVNRMNKKILDFMRFSKPVDYKIEKTGLKEIFKTVSESLSIVADEKKVEIDCSCDENIFVMCDREYFEMALKNIVLNGIEASEEGGTVKIDASKKESDVKIVIKDSGAGIEISDLKKVFDLYYTTKESGSGVGLATAYKIIKEHRGEIFIESDAGKGTRVTILCKGGGFNV